MDIRVIKELFEYVSREVTSQPSNLAITPPVYEVQQIALMDVWSDQPSKRDEFKIEAFPALYIEWDERFDVGKSETGKSSKAASEVAFTVYLFFDQSRFAASEHLQGSSGTYTNVAALMWMETTKAVKEALNSLRGNYFAYCEVVSENAPLTNYDGLIGVRLGVEAKVKRFNC